VFAGWVTYLSEVGVYLDRRLAQAPKLNLSMVEDAAADFLRSFENLSL
jgi:hypothetical protein